VPKVGTATEVPGVVDRLFVYGSLRAGQAARSLIADHVVRAGPATTTGTLIAFPEYPAMIDSGPETVVGELIWLRDLAAALALLDAYEGEDYRRVLKRIRLSTGEDEWGWCYVLADPALAIAGTAVPGGDWVRWVAERDD